MRRWFALSSLLAALTSFPLTNVDSPYIAPSRVPSVTRISKVPLTVPVRRLFP